MADNKTLIGGGKLQNFIVQKIIRVLYAPLMTLVFRENIWRIYKSYHSKPANWKKVVWNKYMEKHAASISIDAKIASPLILPHGVSGIFLTRSAEIGKNVVIFQQVTIGANTIKGSKSYGAPVIGDNVYVGAGAKIIGSAHVSNNCRIGANAVVIEDVPYNSLVVCEKPRIITKDIPLDNSFNPYLS